MAYVDYEFYKDTYLGNAVPEADFNRLAADMADNENVMKAACAVAEAMQTNEQGGDVVSQSVGSWSRSFSKTTKTDSQRLLDAAQMYLHDLIPKVRWA